MSKLLLEIDSLQVAVGSKVVIENLQLNLKEGEVVALMGANGSGKSSFAMTLLGDSRYQVLEPKGIVRFNGKDLLEMSIDERSRAGLFVAWQNPVSIPGVSVFRLCKTCYEAQGNKINELVAFKTTLEKLAIKVGLSKEHISRNINEGFSGGEKKRLEILQLLLLRPKLVILDEIDSGLDTGGLKMIVKVVNEMKKTGITFVLITHNKNLLNDILIDKICEMKYGKLSTGV